MTSCSNVRENISAFIDNELSKDERLSFEAHMMSCKECKSELDEMHQVVRLCLDLPQRELPVDFKAELHEKLLVVAKRQQSPVKSIKKSRSFLFSKTFASIAAGMLLIFLAGSYYKFGLFSPVKSQDSTNSTAIETEQPAAAREAKLDIFGYSGEAENAGDAEKAAKSFGASGADAQSFEVDRSATVQNRESALAGAGQMLKMETANNKLSTITITVDNPELQAKKISELALGNNGDVVDISAFSTNSTIISFSEQVVSNQSNVDGVADNVLPQTNLYFIIPDMQYTQFVYDLNTVFGEANVQKGALVTEDMTDVLNNMIAKSNEIDNRIQELQKKDSEKNAGEINKLKMEKDAVDNQTEKVRIGTDFIHVTVLLNKK